MITLQISGDGPLSMLVMQCSSKLELRGMAHADVPNQDAPYSELVSRANCAITVDGGDIERPYQGIVEVSGASLAESLEAYYRLSAQTLSHLTLIGEPNLAGGILLQQIPQAGGTREDDWRRLGLLAATLAPGDLADGAGLLLLSRLFAEDDLRVFKPRDVVFRCHCSQRRAEDVLRLLGQQDTEKACREQGAVDVTCEYCGRTRTFDEVDISRVFAGGRSPLSGSLH
jgi:molecular chaperone Hsp33